MPKVSSDILLVVCDELLLGLLVAVRIDRPKYIQEVSAHHFGSTHLSVFAYSAVVLTLSRYLASTLRQSSEELLLETGRRSAGWQCAYRLS